MTQTFEKIALGIIFVVLVGFNSFFILGQQNDTAVFRDNDVSAAGKATAAVPLKEINEEQARTIARGVAEGIITEIKEKTVNGITFYEVEIEDSNMETEIKINKKGGNILRVVREEKEPENEDEEVSPKELQTIRGVLTKERAIAIALELINGNVISFEAEREGGRLIYEVEIAAQGDVAEVEIDAETGEVLEIEWEDD